MPYGDDKGVHKRTLHLQIDTESKFGILTFPTSVNTDSLLTQIKFIAHHRCQIGLVLKVTISQKKSLFCIWQTESITCATCILHQFHKKPPIVLWFLWATFEACLTLSTAAPEREPSRKGTLYTQMSCTRHNGYSAGWLYVKVCAKCTLLAISLTNAERTSSFVVG